MKVILIVQALAFAVIAAVCFVRLTGLEKMREEQKNRELRGYNVDMELSFIRGQRLIITAVFFTCLFAAVSFVYFIGQAK